MRVQTLSGTSWEGIDTDLLVHWRVYSASGGVIVHCKMICAVRHHTAVSNGDRYFLLSSGMQYARRKRAHAVSCLCA